jgi:hypothetical protein
VRSWRDRSAHDRLSGVDRRPDSNSVTSSLIGRALSCSVSYQALKIWVKIHCVRRY